MNFPIHVKTVENKLLSAGHTVKDTGHRRLLLCKLQPNFTVTADVIRPTSRPIQIVIDLLLIEVNEAETKISTSGILEQAFRDRKSDKTERVLFVRKGHTKVTALRS